MPTIADVLALDVFAEAQAEVVAGSRNLAAEVRWVHIADLLDVGHLLHGGELLLTTGLGLRDGDTGSQVRYVSQLQRAGVAGVVIELGPALRDVPSTLREAAEAAGLPVIALHRETRYVDITERVHEIILNGHLRLLERADEVARAFTNSLRMGVTRAHIVRRLADVLGHVVVLEDGARHVVEFAPETEASLAVVEGWHAHSRCAHGADSAEGGEQGAGDAAPACLWRPITVRAEPWGRIHLIAVDRPFDRLDELVIDRIAAIIDVSLLNDPTATPWTERATVTLNDDLARGGYLSGDELLRRARAAGVTLDRMRLAAMVVVPLGLADHLEQRELSEAERRDVGSLMASEVRSAVSRCGCRGLVSRSGDTVLALVGVNPQRAVKDALSEVGQSAAARIAEALAGVRVVVGVSREATPDAAARAFEEARDAAHRGRLRHDCDSVYHFDDFSFEDLLLRMAEGPNVARFIEGELGPILDHDARSGAELLSTLKTYLTSQNAHAAAAALNIGRRSLYHRLERITELLGGSLDDGERRFRLWLALRALDILADRSVPTRP